MPPKSAASTVIRLSTPGATGWSAIVDSGAASGRRSAGRCTRPVAFSIRPSSVTRPPRSNRSTITVCVRANTAVLDVPSTRVTWFAVVPTALPWLRPSSPRPFAPAEPPAGACTPSFARSVSPPIAACPPTLAFPPVVRDSDRDRPVVSEPMSRPTIVHAVEWPR